MQPYRLRASGRVADLLRGMHPQLRRRVRAAIDMIRTDPISGKELRDELAGLRSFRVARFRVVYRIAADRTIELVAIGPRRTIYTETLRQVRRP